MEQAQQPSEEGTGYAEPPADETRRQRGILIGIVVAVLVIVASLVASIWALTLPSTDTAKIRDIFIIFMALESLLLMLVLVILIIQMARLINLLQNEIKPILDSTNETVSTLRGTSVFLGDNLVQPVIRLNEYLASLQSLLLNLGLTKKQPKRSPKGE